jgi:hypothetical protein
MEIRNTQLSDWIKVYDDMINEDFCDTYLNIYNNNIDSIDKIELDYRRCGIYSKLDSHPEYSQFKLKILEIFRKYVSEMNNSNLYHLKYIESPNIIRYSEDISHGSNQFSYHSDNWNMPTASRQLSIILYLNDVVEGGETEFPQLGIKVSPKKGRLLIFPSFYLYAHSGKQPISGPKYIIVSWIHFGGQGHAFRVSDLNI